MANNLHITYELVSPGRNSEKVIDRIKKLGGWAKVHTYFWYVDSQYTAHQAADFIAEALEPNDKIYVVDCKNNSAAFNILPDQVSKFILDHWQN